MPSKKPTGVKLVLIYLGWGFVAMLIAGLLLLIKGWLGMV